MGAAASGVDTPLQTPRRPTVVGLLSRAEPRVLGWLQRPVVCMLAMGQTSTPWVNHFLISTTALRTRKWQEVAAVRPESRKDLSEAVQPGNGGARANP